MLQRLLYVSTLSRDLRAIHLEDIVSVATSANREKGISGYLAFGNQRVLQCLEGESEGLAEITRKILNDGRHTHFEILDWRTVQTREFEAWGMGYNPNTEENRRRLAEIAAAPRFDPYGWNPKLALQFLQVLADSERVTLRG